MSVVRDLVGARAGGTYVLPDATSHPVEASPIVDNLLKTPLTADGAVQVAIYNNAGLKASLAELGIAEAD